METNSSLINMTKSELEQLLLTTQKEIQEFDTKTTYSFSYYFYYNDGCKRNNLAKKLDEIKLQIMYKEDDEHFAKYKPMKDKDPLKMFPKFYLEHK